MKRTCRVYRMGMTHTCPPVDGNDRFVACISFGSLKPPQGGRYENAQPVRLGASSTHNLSSQRLVNCGLLVRTGRGRRRSRRRRFAIIGSRCTDRHSSRDNRGGHDRGRCQRASSTGCACTTSCATCCSRTGFTLSERKRGRQDSSDEENFFHAYKLRFH